MRQTLLLNDDWKFHCGDIPNKYLMGHYESYSHSKANNGLGAAAANYYDGDFATVHLPHDYVLDGEVSSQYNDSQGSYKRDTAWYRKHFTLPCKVDESRVVVLFDGAGKHTTVWCNGHYAGENNSMYNSFYLDITPYLQDDGVNTLAVKIENDDIEGWWYEGAGIYRDVWLVITDAVAVDVWGTYVNPMYTGNEQWDVAVETTVFNNDTQYTTAEVRQSICDATGAVLATAQGSLSLTYGENLLKQTLQVANPTRWDLDSCVLHTLKTEVLVNGAVVDAYETKFGFRTIEFTGTKGFYLNDKHVKLHGACLHQDHGNLGIAVPRAVNRYRLDKLQSIGINAYRCAHNMTSSTLLDLCDEMGVLVLDENRWFNYSEKTQKELSTMLKRDRNHPSVIVWMVGNEEPLQSTLTGKRLVKHLKSIVKTYDTTRPVSIALNGGFYDSHAAGMSDIVAVNYNIKNYDMFPIAHPNKCIIATESGASRNSRGNYFSDDLTRYASAYDKQRAPFGSAYIDAIRASETHDFVCGTFPWTGIEYRGEARWPRLFSGSGFFDNCGFEKDNAYMVQSCWTQEPMVHVFPHWSLQGKEGQLIDMVVYSNTEEVELVVNGVSQGKQVCEACQSNAWKVEYQPGNIKAIGYVNGQVVAEKVWYTTGDAAKMVIDCHNTTVDNTGEDCAIFKVSLIDAQGNWLPNADNLLSVTLADPTQGQILAVSGGDTVSHISARATDRQMHNGLLQVIVRAKKGASEIVLNAKDTEMGLSAEYILPIAQVAEIPSVASSDRGMSIDGFRVWNDCTGFADIAKEYNFDDMNTSEPVTLATYEPEATLPYLCFTAKALMPQCDKAMRVCLMGLKGEYAIKMFHDPDVWPSPTPDEFLTIETKGNLTESTDLRIPLTGFLANEKIKVIVILKQPDAAFMDACFEVIG